MKSISLAILSILALTSCMEYENAVEDYDTTPSDPISNPSGTKRLKKSESVSVYETEIDVPAPSPSFTMSGVVESITKYNADYSLIETTVSNAITIDYIDVQEISTVSNQTIALNDFKMQNQAFTNSQTGETTTTNYNYTWENEKPIKVEVLNGLTSSSSEISYSDESVRINTTNNSLNNSNLLLNVAGDRINNITLSSDSFGYDVLFEMDYTNSNLTSLSISTSDGLFNTSYAYTYDSQMNPLNIYNQELSDIKLGNAILNVASIDYSSIDNEFNTNFLEAQLRFLTLNGENNLLNVTSENASILNTVLTYDTDGYPQSGTQTSFSTQENYVELPNGFDLEPVEVNATIEYTYY